MEFVVSSQVGAQVPDKYWFASQVNNHNQSAADLGRQFGIKRRRITEWARLARNGKRLCPGMGRPKCLDEAGMENLRCAHRDFGDLDKMAFRSIVRQEYSECNNRVDEHLEEPRKWKKMTRKTVQRYVDVAYGDRVW